MQDYICLLIVQNLLCVMRSQSNETTLFCFTFIKEFEKFFSNILQNNLYKLLKNCVQQNLAKVGGCMRSFNLCNKNLFLQIPSFSTEKKNLSSPPFKSNMPLLKGTVSRDFRPLVFSLNCTLGPPDSWDKAVSNIDLYSRSFGKFFGHDYAQYYIARS
jgi:hypothetical protein